MIRKLHFTYEGGDATVSCNHTIYCDGAYEKDFEVTAANDGQTWPLSIQLQLAMAVVITATCAMRLRFEDQVIDVDDEHPVIWFRGGTTKCPLHFDVEDVTVNLMSDDPTQCGILRVRVPESNRPQVAPLSPSETPPPTTLAATTPVLELQSAA